MRDYQRQKNNPYLLPLSVYRRTLYLVRDYDRIKREIAGVPFQTHTGDGQPRGTDTSDPTGNAALKMEKLWQDCKAIDDALFKVPQEYRRGVLNSILDNCGYPVDAGQSTYGRWKCIFLYHVAKNSLLI